MTRRLSILISLTGAFFLSSMISCDNGSSISVQDVETIKDIDGNVYHTIVIGNQVWTLENFRATRFNDGSAIPFAQSDSSWAMRTIPAYCFFNNTSNPDSMKKFGALYNWYAVDTKKLPPDGWHVPTANEWTVLEKFLISAGNNWDGSATGNKIAKSLAAQTD